MIIAFIVLGVFDITYYTYASLLGITCFLAIGLVGLFVEPVMRFYSIYIFPILLQSSVLVAFLIVIVVQLNSAIFTSHLVGMGGTLSAGTLHTGDFMAHFWTCIDQLITLIAIHHLVRRYIREYWFESSTLRRVLYVLFTLLGVLIPLGLYMVAEDWQARYPVPINPVLSVLLVALLGAVIGAVFFMFAISTHDLAYAAPPCAKCGAVPQCTSPYYVVISAAPAARAVAPSCAGSPSYVGSEAPSIQQRRHIDASDQALEGAWRV